MFVQGIKKGREGKANFLYLQVNSPWEKAPEQPLLFSSATEEM
jgi:hypothetical protein